MLSWRDVCFTGVAFCPPHPCTFAPSQPPPSFLTSLSVSCPFSIPSSYCEVCLLCLPGAGGRGVLAEPRCLQRPSPSSPAYRAHQTRGVELQGPVSRVGMREAHY